MEKFVEWDDKYATGVELIDAQHKKLFAMTNALHASCLDPKEVEGAFVAAMHASVTYVKEHFSAEEALLSKLGYPDLAAHKRMHADFSQKILESVNQFQKGKKFLAIETVRFLRDWIQSHILVNDAAWATWLRNRAKSASR